MLKDMKIAVALAGHAGVPNALGAPAVELWSKAADDLPGDADHSEIARWMKERLTTRGELSEDDRR